MSAQDFQKKAEFLKQDLIMDQIYKNGMQSYAESIGDLHEAFVLSDRCIRCIDEGTPGGVHIAGSGILFDSPETLKEYVTKAHVEGIYSHEGCGAAALYAKQNGLDLTNTDQYGKEFSSKMAEELGIEYKGHISANEMTRPETFHNARVSYYDLTGSFDPQRVEKLPHGFVISRRYLEEEYAKKELDVSLSIAFGDHGYADLLTNEQPYVVIIVAQTQDELDSMKQEIQSVVDSYTEKVQVDGFLMPMQ